MFKVFEITADYRPNNENKPKYYVVDKDIKSAKKLFSEAASWLKIYNCVELDKEKAFDILTHRNKHCIFTSEGYNVVFADGVKKVIHDIIYADTSA